MATQDQSLVTAALEALKLDYQEPSPPGMMGGDATYKVTADTLAFLKGKTVIVSSDGSVTVK